jgi:hypothetical protein
MWNQNSPQTRHSATESKKENGGILRVSAEASFDGKLALFDAFFPYSKSKVLI